MATTQITDKGNVLTPALIDIINGNATKTITTDGGQTIAGALTVTGGLITGPVKRTLTAITADGAIDPHTSANYIFTKAGAAVMTLAAPTATTDDGIVITMINTTTDQDTVTATGLFLSGATAANVATWPAHAGGTLTIMAWNAKWVILSNNLVVMS